MAPQFDLVELFSGEGNVGKVWRPAIQIEIYIIIHGIDLHWRIGCMINSCQGSGPTCCTIRYQVL